MSNEDEKYELTRKKLTTNQLRKFSGLDYLSEKEANKIIESLYQLSLLAYDIFQSKLNKKTK